MWSFGEEQRVGLVSESVISIALGGTDMGGRGVQRENLPMHVPPHV